MKILYCITKGNWGGAQKYVYDLATSLASKDFECVVAIGEGDELKTRLQNSKIRVITLKGLGRDISLLQDIKTILNLFRLFKKERPDIIHLNSSKIGGLGTLAGRLARVKRVIFTAHGFPFNEDREVFSKCLIYIFTILTVFLSDKTICVSQKDADSVPKIHFLRKKIIYIPLGQREEKRTEQKEAREHLETLLEKPADFLSSMFLIGTIAELTRNKGVSYAINAAKEIPEASLIIIGCGEEETKLKEQVKNLGLEDRVFFTGYVKDASRLIKAFDCILITSKKEGLPYSLLEAGQAGLPVIASPVGGIPDIIEHGKNGFLTDPKDARKTASIIREIMLNKPAREQIGSSLRDTVKKRHSFDAMISDTLKIYKN